VRLHGITGERRSVHTGVGEGAQIVGVPVSAAGDQRDRVALLAETVCDGLAEAALADPDPWHGFTGFLEGMFVIQARDRSMNEAIARTPVGSVDVAGECGRAGGVLESVVSRARDRGVLRPDFGADDLATMIGAMSKVIAMSNGDDAVWRRHLGFVLDGLRTRQPPRADS
jgi:hypothetical protein